MFVANNIRNGRNGGLESALRGVYQTNMDLGILQGKKGRQAQSGRAAGAGVKKASVGRGCVGVLGVLRGVSCQLGSALTTSVTVVTGDWSRH